MQILNTAFIAVILSSLVACSGSSNNANTNDDVVDGMDNPSMDSPQTPPSAMGFTELTRELLEAPESADATEFSDTDMEIEMDIDANDDPNAFDAELAAGS